MSDLLAKCDWNGDELRVELPQWPEVVTVWVDGKAMPFVPVTDPDALGVIKCLQGLADATSAENKKLRELVERAWKTAERLCQAFDGPCKDDGVTIYKPCPLGERDEECVYGQLQRDIAELGIEVVE